MKRILLILIIVLWQSVVWAQISVKGKITDVNGKGVEYVSVGVDSLFTLYTFSIYICNLSFDRNLHPNDTLPKHNY